MPWNTLLSFADRFRRSTHGNIAVIAGLCLVPVALTVGIGVDLHHRSSVQNAVQDGLDAALLAAASSQSEDEVVLEQLVRDSLTAHLQDVDIEADYDLDLDIDVDGSRIAAVIDGRAPTFFAGILGRGDLPVWAEATAVSGAGESVELALVVDNTWSMSADAGGGVTRIAALREAAHELVGSIMVDSEQVRVSLIPYADYVNVGTANRSESWMNVPADYSVTSPRTCTTLTTRNVCTGGVRGTRTVLVDGVPTQQTYWVVPQTCSVQTVAPYQSCSGGGTTNYRWYGCVASRNVSTLRQNDERPDVRHTGFLATSQTCLNPVIPLTGNRSVIDRGIDNLVINIGSYRPETFIPSGMVWGVHALSPSLPFNEGEPYGENVRKIIVLMTDGTNTLRYRASDGRHISAPNSTAADADARAICDYAKARGIQIYTVGLSVPAGPSRDLMRYCATSEANAFDANDATELLGAFRGIARSINTVRLTH
jgi:hypothetical protein